MNLEMVKVVKYLEGDLKGYYVAEIQGFNGNVIKSKDLSKMLIKLAKYFKGQGE